MKAFGLIRKHIDWSKGNKGKETVIQWLVYFWWPTFFYTICTAVSMCFLQAPVDAVVPTTLVAAVISGAMCIACLEEYNKEYYPQCFLPNWFLIGLMDIALLPLVGAMWFLKEIRNHTGQFVDASKRKLSFVSIRELANGKFNKNRLQPYLLGKRRSVWNEKLILEIAHEIAHDQIGRLTTEEESGATIVREIVALEETKIDKENKTAQICFSVTLCTRKGSDDKIEAGYYFVNLAFDERLNAVDVSNIFFDSKRGQKTKQELHQAFKLYQANISDDFGLGFDPLGVRDRKELLTEPDFSPDISVIPVVPTGNARVAE